jgi:hypothetical protein
MCHNQGTLRYGTLNQGTAEGQAVGTVSREICPLLTSYSICVTMVNRFLYPDWSTTSYLFNTFSSCTGYIEWLFLLCRPALTVFISYYSSCSNWWPSCKQVPLQRHSHELRHPRPYSILSFLNVTVLQFLSYRVPSIFKYVCFRKSGYLQTTCKHTAYFYVISRA